MLLFFNLIPLGPLDGAAVLAGLLPRVDAPARRAQSQVRHARPAGAVLHAGLRSLLMRPVYRLAAAWMRTWLNRLVPA